MKGFRFLVAILSLAVTAIATAQLPDGLKFDDGFTWVECHNFEIVENNVVKGFWVPEVSFRIWGKVPDRSGWKMELKQNGKKISEYMNDGYPLSLNRGPSQGLVIVGWWKDVQRTNLSGPMDLDVYYIDGTSNKEYLAKTLKIDVRKVARTRGSVGQRDQYAPSFYINRHGEILSSILYFRDAEFPSYTQVNGLTYFSDRAVELVFNYSENENFAGPTLGRLVVEVDGKPVEMKVPDNTVMQDEMGLGEQAGKYNVEHSDRDADQYFKGGTAYKERIGFARRSMILPLHWGPKPKNPQSKVFTNDHPGEWKVTWLIERKPVRIFRFKIGADGLPVKHPEQDKGLVLAPNAVLVDMEIPGEGGEFDGRLTNEFVKQGGFFGRAWATIEMQNAAAAVPKKGRPFPISSSGKG